MPADKTQTGRRALQPACDACHIRRVKCSHDQPCAHCSRLGLTCTYTKAHTAKKTAGKRIEALRQAEKNRQSYVNKRNEMWGASPPDGQPNSAFWNHAVGSSSNGGNGSGYGSSSGAGFPGDPRYGYPNQQPVKDERAMHPFYTNAPAATTSPSNVSSSSNSGTNVAGNTSGWGPTSSPRSRASYPYDSERQVRFQSIAPPPTNTHRSHFGSVSNSSNNNSMSMPLSSTQQIAPSLAGSNFRDVSSNDAPYLPSPAQFFASSGNRASFEAQQQHPSSDMFGTQLPVQNFDASTSNAANPLSFEANVSSLDYLQSSVLPPFSTSMADSLFNDQNIFSADNIFNESSMPPLVNAGNGQQTVLDMLGACLPSGETPGSVDSASIGTIENIQNSIKYGEDVKQDFSKSDEDITENHPLSDSVLIPTLALFYERLGGVMPVFSRTWLFSRLDKDDHQTDPHFAAMLIAMSALVVIQAQQPNADAKDKRADRLSARKRRAKATRLLEEALRLREGPTLGQHSSLEMCCTSFFVFATLFGLGEHSAAWYRLRESITLAHLCRLHEPSAYEGLPRDEAERRLRTYWLLAITERAFAIQRGMPIVLTGNPRASTASLRAKLGFKELSDFPDLQLRLFDHVDEKFVDCWNRKCQGPGCPNFDSERAIALWRSFTDGINQPGSRERSTTGEEREEEGLENGGSGNTSGPKRVSMLPATPTQRRQIQRADVEVTRHWLLNRLWLITLNHGLLQIDARDPPLRVDHAIHVAQSVYDVCDSLSMAAMEAHGVGFTYKLFDIAQTLVLLYKNESIAEAVSKGGVGDQLEKRTTKAHTGGRGHLTKDHRSSSSSKQGADSSSSVNNANNSFSLHMFGDVVDPSMVNVVQGPASLRRIVMGILNEYLTLFEKFRGGDHPYLEKLVELINDLNSDRDPFGTSSSVNGISAIATGLGSSHNPSTSSTNAGLTGTNNSSIDAHMSVTGAGTTSSSLDEPHNNLTEANTSSVDTPSTHQSHHSMSLVGRIGS